MAERETREFKTSGGHTVLLNAYLTAREMMSVTDKKDELTGSQMTDQLLNFAVVQIDGSAENIKERLLDLPAKDYLELAKEMSATITPTTPGSSEQPGSDTSAAA